MPPRTRPLLSPQDYLELERRSDQRHAYLNGEIFAMGGASESHNLITMNTAGSLWQQLKQRPCKVYSNDMRVKVDSSGLYTYPDIVVLCGEARFDDEQRDTLLNPTVLIEVLSDSTKDYDRGEKFSHYRRLDSLRDYLLIAQDQPHLEHYQRQPENRWLLSETNDPDAGVRLESIDCALTLREIYAKVAFGN